MSTENTYTVTDYTGSVVATATGTHAEKGLWASSWRRSGYTVTVTPVEPETSRVLPPLAHRTITPWSAS